MLGSNKMALDVQDIRKYFRRELKNENFTIDKTGAMTIEMIGASFIADEEAIFGKVNKDYVASEIDWYLSGSTNINDIYEDRDPPEAWKYAANKHGEINSNYGHLIFDDKYFNQFDCVLGELIRNPDSRRAIMIYNRPSMQIEFTENGKNDFICTNASTFYIRDGKMHSVTQMRSNDVVFGYKNDRAWAKYVLDEMVWRYNASSNRDWIHAGHLYWQVQNLHVYDRHFDLVK